MFRRLNHTLSLFLLLAILVGCSDSDSNKSEALSGESLLLGNGYVHYHIYPDVGTCYRGEVDFRLYDKMIAAVSSSIHAYFDNSLATRDLYVRVISDETGDTVVVAAIDKGGVQTEDFQKRDQHIMDISEEAFLKLDRTGSGMKAGRIYVRWEMFEPEK